MQENITTFEDILGGCERLLRTPIPVSYTRHTSRFLLLWLTILPYALWAKLAWATVPAVGLIALLLLGAFCHLSLFGTQCHHGVQRCHGAPLTHIHLKLHDDDPKMESGVACMAKSVVHACYSRARIWMLKLTIVAAGIEEIGVEIEEPFGILPLEVISNKAKADIIEIMNRQDTVKDIACTEESPAQTKVNGTVFDLPQSREPAKMW